MRLLEPIEEIVLFAEPNQQSNVYGEARIWASGLNCFVVAITKHETEVEETLKMGIPSFNLYRLTGEGLEREAIDEIKLKESRTSICLARGSLQILGHPIIVQRGNSRLATNHDTMRSLSIGLKLSPVTRCQYTARRGSSTGSPLISALISTRG